MAVTIGGNNPYVSTYNRINRSTQATTQRIATGSNYPSAAYGASEHAVSVRLTSNIGATAQSTQNVQNMSSMLKVAEGATKNTISALTTLKEHLINAANDSNTSLDRNAIQKTVNQIVKQIDDNAYVEYNGKRLLDGSQQSLTVAGIDGYREIPVGDLRSQALGLTDSAGNVKIDVSTVEGAQNALEIVGKSLEFVEEIDGEMYASGEGFYSLEDALDEATTQGAQLQRLEFQAANYETMEENQMAAQSGMSDADIAKQITNLRSDQTLEQLALFAARMFNQNRASALNILQ